MSTRTKPDVALVERARAGSQEAFFELVRHYASPLSNYLRSWLHRIEDVDDVAQESFARAFAKIGELRDPQSFPGWLWQIARCAAIDRQRHLKRSREENETVSHEEIDEKTSGVPSAEFWLRHQDLVDEVRETMNSLEEPARTIIKLRYAEDLSYAEIGERLCLSVIQVKARLARARHKLRGRLGELRADWEQIRDDMP